MATQDQAHDLWIIHIQVTTAALGLAPATAIAVYLTLSLQPSGSGHLDLLLYHEFMV